MARHFYIQVEGLPPQINEVMLKNALDNALEKFRKNWIARKVTKKDVRDVLDNLIISSIHEQI
jgi:hypothetical protein